MGGCPMETGRGERIQVRIKQTVCLEIYSPGSTNSRGQRQRLIPGSGGFLNHDRYGGVAALGSRIRRGLEVA